MTQPVGNSVRTIAVGALARVEGEGAFTIRMRDGQVDGVELRIFEPPRFFEAFMRGRSAQEAPDLTARICGICPVAYQMSSVHAIEKINGITLPAQLRALRRLLYCGEWIESHTLHVFMLHAPDFLGFESAVVMARANPVLAQRVKDALRIKKAGNSLVEKLGGRAVHPINVRVGGFYRLPTRAELAPLIEEFKWVRDAARDAVRWAASLSFPDFDGDYEFVALRHPGEYPMNEGRVVSTKGLDVPQEDFLDHFAEYQVPHSNALQSRKRNRSDGDGIYFVGPMARWNLNLDKVPLIVREAAAETGLPSPVTNPYHSIIVRCLEVLLAVEEAARILADYEPSSPASVAFEPRAGVGRGITEAPRGILFQEYETDEGGMIKRCTIVPPTSQNQAQIERDLFRLATQLVALPDEQAAMQAERVIRNYDPCISCATHFLRFKVEGRWRARVRVIGVGSPNGDDAIGMEVVRRLENEMGTSSGIDFRVVDSGQRLLDHVDQATRLILIDALLGRRRQPGTIHRFNWPDPRIEALGPGSTHVLGVPQALELAAALGHLPEQVVIYAIEIDDADPGHGISPTSIAALSELTSRLRREIESLQGAE